MWKQVKTEGACAGAEDGDGCDASNGRYDDNSDTLFSIEHPDDFCPLTP